MPLVLIDGFDDLSSYASTSNAAITTTGARYGSSLTFTSLGDVRFTIPAAQESDTITIGVAVFIPSIASSTALFILRSDTATTIHVQSQINTDGSIDVRRGGASPVLGTSAAGVVTLNTWNYIELQTKLHDTTGFATVRVNGTQVLALTNVDTKNAGTKTTFDQLRVNGGAGWLLDDLYVKTGAGDTFLGQITVETIYPDGNGASSGVWLGSDGDTVDNYLQVDEPVVSTSDYNRGTVASKDQFTLTDLVHTDGTIVGLIHTAHVALFGSGGQTFRIINRRAIDSPGSLLATTSGTFANFHHILETDPETGAAWTIANVNALQTGVAWDPGLGEARSMTSGATITLTLMRPIAIGDLVVVYVAADNLSSTTPTFTSADSGGNTYVTHAQRAQSSTPAAGVAVAIMASKATVAVAVGGTITVTLSGAVVAKAVYAEAFTGFQNTLRNAAVVGSSSSGDPVQVTSGSANAGDLAIGAVAFEQRRVPAPETSPDTNGIWSDVVAVPSDITLVPAPNTCVTINRQYKVTTGAGAQQIIFSSAGNPSALAICLFTP